MYYLISHKHKVIFGTSPKAGSQHINFLFNYIHGNLSEHPFQFSKHHTIPNRFYYYKLFLFIRNPYERLISGYREKYSHSYSRKYQIPKFSSDTLTFKHFVKELYKTQFKYIDRHHFEPQSQFLIELPFTQIYDIQNIDYDFISKTVGKTIPDDLKYKRGDHTDKSIKPWNQPVHDLKNHIYRNYRVEPFYYYNEVIKNMVKRVYSKDLYHFAKYGFFFDIDICIDEEEF